MRTYSAAIIALALLGSTAALAEESSFHNILTTSRTIISPSQYYQHKEGILVEADIASSDGSIKVEDGPLRTDLDIKGTAFGAAGFIAINPSLVLGLRALQDRAEYENTLKNKNIVLQPSVTYSPVPGLSVAAQVNILRTSFKAEGADEKTSKANNFTLGMTAHQEAWEGTIVLSTKKDGGTNEQSIPQKVGLHGRYRIAEPITLGLSFEQRDFSAISGEGFDDEDETRIGVHMEAAMSETFAVEFDYYSTTAEAGDKDSDGSEFVLMGQTLITPTLEAGVQVSYATVDGDGIDSKLVRPGLFVSAKF